jgi:HD-like signal output (HDOD) protein
VVDTIKYDPGLTANVLNMADLAFTAGLLHDIGKLVLSTFVDDGFNAI